MTDRELMHAIVMRHAEEANDANAPWHYHDGTCTWCELWNEFKTRAGYEPAHFWQAEEAHLADMWADVGCNDPMCEQCAREPAEDAR